MICRFIAFMTPSMGRYSRNNKVSEQTKDEALKIAKGTQRPGQTKEQTRLIAQGIQKGIDLYKKQQKAKARELDKKLKKVSQPSTEESPAEPAKHMDGGQTRTAWLPWTLLVLSWLGFGVYLSL